jgi:hypothetical protein
MFGTLNAGEEQQLIQTIEMFEVITQSQPLDYQSLEILKEAYSKLDRNKDVSRTAKRIAQAYVQLGQLSSAILEYETILQQYPDDPDALAAMAEIESTADTLTALPAVPSAARSEPRGQEANARRSEKEGFVTQPVVCDDGRAAMQKLFIDAKFITPADFDACWPGPDLYDPPASVMTPFIQILADRGISPLEKSLRLLSEKARLGFLPLDKYEVDVEFARSFPRDTCRRWCVMPFDRMSKSIFVATNNPFNNQAAQELQKASELRIIWYLTTPHDLVKVVNKIFR